MPTRTRRCLCRSAATSVKDAARLTLATGQQDVLGRRWHFSGVLCWPERRRHRCTYLEHVVGDKGQEVLQDRITNVTSGQLKHVRTVLKAQCAAAPLG